MDNGRYLTLEEAALEVNKKVSWIKKRIRRRELDAKFEGGRWLVSAKSLHKIAPATSSSKAETTIGRSLTPSPSRKAPAEMKPTAQEGSAHEATEAPKPTKEINVPVFGSKGGRAEPNPNRREAIELRIEELDRKIARFGDLLRKEMLEHGLVGDGHGPEA